MDPRARPIQSRSAGSTCSNKTFRFWIIPAVADARDGWVETARLVRSRARNRQRDHLRHWIRWKDDESSTRTRSGRSIFSSSHSAPRCWRGAGGPPAPRIEPTSCTPKRRACARPGRAHERDWRCSRERFESECSEHQNRQSAETGSRKDEFLAIPGTSWRNPLQPLLHCKSSCSPPTRPTRLDARARPSSNRSEHQPAGPTIVLDVARFQTQLGAAARADRSGHAGSRTPSAEIGPRGRSAQARSTVLGRGTSADVFRAIRAARPSAIEPALEWFKYPNRWPDRHRNGELAATRRSSASPIVVGEFRGACCLES